MKLDLRHDKSKKVLSRIMIGAFLISSLLSTNITTQAATPSAASSYATAFDSANQSSVTILDSSWGLGTYQTEYVSNNKSYDWYIDQGNTGSAANNNCGPSCAVMTMKWLRNNFTGTVQQARALIPENGGWWYTDNIENYFKYNAVTTYSFHQYVSETFLKSQLKQGNIAILCIDTSYLPYNNNSQQRVGRFYAYQGGHFIIVKGYRVVDGKTFFEVYDSNNWNEQYSDGQPKGKDRYYLSNNLISAATNWWNYSIIIQPE